MPPPDLPDALQDLVDDFHEVVDGVCSRRPDSSAFTELRHTTSVLEAVIEAPRHKHKDIVPVLQQMGEPSGVVIAINSNFGGVVQPHYEEYLKTGAKPKKNAPAGRKHRQPEGQGGCFSSALEPIIRPPPESEVYRQLEEKGLSGIVYKLKYFPTTGSFQVAGTRLINLYDGYWATQAFVDYLNRTQILGGPAYIVDGSFHLAKSNFKFHLRKRVARQMINFDELSQLLLAEKDWPVPIIETTMRVNGRETAFKFNYNAKKNPRVTLYHVSGKANFMGFPSAEFATKVHEILNRIFMDNWDTLVQLMPLSDNAPILRQDEFECYLESLRERQKVVVPELPKGVA